MAAILQLYQCWVQMVQGGSGLTSGKTFLQKSGQTLKQAAQGSGGFTIPRSVQETWRRGTEEYGFMSNIGGRWMAGVDGLSGPFQSE